MKTIKVHGVKDYGPTSYITHAAGNCAYYIAQDGTAYSWLEWKQDNVYVGDCAQEEKDEIARKGMVK